MLLIYPMVCLIILQRIHGWYTLIFLLHKATIPQQFIVDVESTLTKDKLFEPTLEPTLENGLADDLFEAMEDITEEIGNCLYCNATYLECGGILQSF